MAFLNYSSSSRTQLGIGSFSPAPKLYVISKASASQRGLCHDTCRGSICSQLEISIKMTNKSERGFCRRLLTNPSANIMLLVVTRRLRIANLG